MTAVQRTRIAEKFARIEAAVERHGWICGGSSTTAIYFTRRTRDGLAVDVDITADGDQFSMVVKIAGSSAYKGGLTATAIIAKLSA
jgi:hypothetical protein